MLALGRTMVASTIVRRIGMCMNGSRSVRRTLTINNKANGSSNTGTTSSGTPSAKNPMTVEERNEAIRQANEAMQGYVQTRILAKQGKLKSKRPPRDETTSGRQHMVQLGLLGSLLVAFVASPFLGRKIARDQEFREKYVPEWFDFSVKQPPASSYYTRQEMHEQMLALDEELHERARQGEFSPDNLKKIRRKLEHPLGRNVSDEDVAMAEKYGWNKIHPGLADDEDEDDDE